MLAHGCSGGALSPPLPSSSQLVVYHLPLLRKSIAIRSYLIIVFFMWAFIVALSRISDYFHHPEDVIAGGIVGAVTSLYVVSV